MYVCSSKNTLPFARLPTSCRERASKLLPVCERNALCTVRACGPSSSRRCSRSYSEVATPSMARRCSSITWHRRGGEVVRFWLREGWGRRGMKRGVASATQREPRGGPESIAAIWEIRHKCIAVADIERRERRKLINDSRGGGGGLKPSGTPLHVGVFRILRERCNADQHLGNGL